MSFDFNELIQAIVDFFELLKEFLNRLEGIEIEEMKLKIIIKPEENF